MRPFTAPITDRSREKFGTYMRRYEREPSMRPFDAPISDRRRELFGEYMRRYETVSSMKPFDAAISERSRQLFGEYRQRWTTRKEGVGLIATTTDADGMNAVVVDFLSWLFEPCIWNMAIYQIKLTMNGGWAGTGYYRITVDGNKVYPFDTWGVINSGVLISLGTLSTNVLMGETLQVEVYSDNAGDVGPAQTIDGHIHFARFIDR